MNLRRFWLFPAVCFLAGCGSGNSGWTSYIQMLREAWHNSSSSGTVSLEQATAVPYASLAFRLDGSSEQLLVLATNTQGDLLWTAASRITLVTRGGRILRTVGLPHDKGQMTSSTPLPAISDALKAPYRSTRMVDFVDLGQYGVTLNCTTAPRGRHILYILGTAMVTTRIDESCNSSNPRWSFTDSYWVNAETGFVWQSIQNLHPYGTVLQVKILRPPE